MAEERYGMYNRLTIEDILNDVLMNPFNGIMGRDLVREPLDRKKDDETEKEDEERKEASEKYRTIMTMGFIKGLYRAAYDNLNLADRAMIPFSEYMRAGDVMKYHALLNKALDQLEEISDLLDSFDDTMAKTLDVWNREGKE